MSALRFCGFSQHRPSPEPQTPGLEPPLWWARWARGLGLWGAQWAHSLRGQSRKLFRTLRCSVLYLNLFLFPAAAISPARPQALVTVKAMLSQPPPPSPHRHQGPHSLYSGQEAIFTSEIFPLPLQELSLTQTFRDDSAHGPGCMRPGSSWGGTVGGRRVSRAHGGVPSAGPSAGTGERKLWASSLRPKVTQSRVGLVSWTLEQIADVSSCG